ncbi:MAG: neutral/alkaline non-lysosomal ceramidase N-terminal domain-containing protein [Candidatus Latescibacterota bacterium]|nr:neutral/alkaline non-lysosomal ceramidase N-terminal domain-containing protein [Candidatus Latescibacterota bacterium]
MTGAGMLLLALLGTPTMAPALQAGAVRVNITPEPVTGVLLSGYEARNDEPSLGLHDSLYARSLVLDDGATSVAVVSLDLIGINPGRLPDLLQETGVEGWLLVATHNHAGPRVLDLSAPYTEDRGWPPEAPYLDRLESQLQEGVRRARARMRPARLAVGTGRVDLAFNRRLVHDDGSVEMIWGRNRTARIPYPPVDPEVGVIRVDALTDEPVAILVNYACHAVVLGGANRWISADFPGAMSAHLETAFPGAVALFLQGGAGDLDPYVDVQSSFAPVVEQGVLLGREAERVATELGLAEPADLDPALRLTRREFTARRHGSTTRQVQTGVDVLRIGERLVLVALPGEPFVDLQLSLKARSPLPFTFLLGYANGYAGYLPTRAAALEGGYGASYGHTLHLEAGTGETMVDEALRVLDPLTVVAETARARSSIGPTLMAGHPNPFNTGLTVPFQLPSETTARLEVHDLRGHLVRTLVDGLHAAGDHRAIWDGRDATGRSVASGVYVLRLRVPRAPVSNRKVLLLR